MKTETTEQNILSNWIEIWSEYVCPCSWQAVLWILFFPFGLFWLYFCVRGPWLTDTVQPQDHLGLQQTEEEKFHVKKCMNKQTCASWTARGGMKIWGKAYIAPWTGLHLIPGTEFRICSVSLALWARASRTELFSWEHNPSYTRVRK